MNLDIHQHRILILDFGSQYTQLIARRIREIGVYCEIMPWDVSNKEIRDFSSLARVTGLEVILEVHNEEELDKICDTVDIVGVNNRNLKDFSVEIETSALSRSVISVVFSNAS